MLSLIVFLLSIIVLFFLRFCTVDKCSKQYICKTLSYRFISFDSDDIYDILRKKENQIKYGKLCLKLMLNASVQISHFWFFLKYMVNH
jgi:hypothetical protein